MALDFPGSPTDGQVYPAPNGVTYVYDSDSGLWRTQGGNGENTVFISATAPVSPTNGKLWWNSVTGTMFVWYEDGDTGQWVPATTQAPAILAPGQNVSVNNADVSGTLTSPAVNGGHAGPRNLIINGDMQVNQRKALNEESNAAGTNYLSADRWNTGTDVLNSYTTSWVKDAPPGFVYSQKLTLTSTSPPAAGDYGGFFQAIESREMEFLNWGTADAQAVNLSFWVKSNVTGKRAGALRFGGAQPNMEFPFSYIINQVDTWEYKTVKVPGVTVGTTYLDVGIYVVFDITYGSDFECTQSQADAGQWIEGYAYSQPDCLTFTEGTPGDTLQFTGIQLRKPLISSTCLLRNHLGNVRDTTTKSTRHFT